MTLLMGIAITAIVALLGLGALWWLTAQIEREFRAFFGIDGAWAAEVRSHEHAADNDAPAYLHGELTAPETMPPASGKSTGSTGDMADA